MIRVFVDTSALIALLSATDSSHDKARRAFETLRVQEATLLTTSYVLVETYALLHRRLGARAVQAFRDSFTPLLTVVEVDGRLHDAGLDVLLEGKRPGLSLVDAVSLVTIREQSIDRVFAFDETFARDGLALTG